jgi:FKBP-type peptidyl-prolyl cis-trans isomerase
LKEEFEDAKGVIRIRISKKNRQQNGQKKKNRQHNGQKKKNRQHNGQKKKYKTTNNDLQIIHIKLTDAL